MVSLTDMKIGLRLNLILSLVIVVGIASLGIYITNSQKNQIELNNDQVISQQVGDLSAMAEAMSYDRSYSHSSAFRIAIEVFKEVKVSTNNDIINTIKAKNNITGENFSVELPDMTLDGRSMFNDERFVDTVYFLTYQSAKLYQLTSQGFVCVSTNIINQDSVRMVGDLFPIEHDISKEILSGTYFVGREIINDEFYKTGYYPIYVDGEVKGMLCVATKDKNLRLLIEQFYKKRFLENGYSVLLHKDGSYIIGKGQAVWDLNVDYNTGTYIVRSDKLRGTAADTEMFKQISSSDTVVGKIRLVENGEEMIYYYNYSPQGNCYVVAVVYQKDLDAIINNTRIVLFVALAVLIFIFILVNRYISKTITKPLEKSVEFAQRISEGELSNDLPVNQKDEVGMLALALRGMVAKLNEVVSEIKEGAENISAASNNINTTSGQLSEGASEQASSLEEVSATMEEMVANIKQNTDNARTTKGISDNAQSEIQEVSEKSDEASQSTKDISGKVNIISDIAFQTNILALNAAVEAARAGEHGKGFSVVASEVRKLADLSKSAAAEIFEISQSSIEMTSTAGTKMKEMLSEIERIALLVAEISAASDEQLNGAEQVNRAVQELNNISQVNAESSEGLASRSSELLTQANRLNDLIAYFKIDI